MGATSKSTMMKCSTLVLIAAALVVTISAAPFVEESWHAEDELLAQIYDDDVPASKLPPPMLKHKARPRKPPHKPKPRKPNWKPRRPRSLLANRRSSPTLPPNLSAMQLRSLPRTPP